MRKPYVAALDTLAARQNAGPDVRLETADAPIDTTVFLTGRLARAARVEAGTSDAPLRLRVQREAGQAVDVRATTTNGEPRQPRPCAPCSVLFCPSLCCSVPAQVFPPVQPAGTDARPGGRGRRAARTPPARRDPS